MEISDKTLDILSNYSKINANIYVQAGNTLSTISHSHDIYSAYEAEEEFEKTFGVYDLREFLSLINLHSAECDFQDQFVLIKSGNSSTKYVYHDPRVLKYPETKISIEQFQVDFELNYDDLNEALQAASILGFENISFLGEKGKLYLVSQDQETESTNEYRKCILDDINDNVKFNFIVPADHLRKLYKGNYKVYLAKSPKSAISKFEHVDLKLEYYIALTKKSEYEEN